MTISIPKRNKLYTVSELTSELKSLLSEHYSIVRLTGEISNFTQAASGHCYFSLKDKNAQINCVLFRNQSAQLRFNLKNGLIINGFGRLSLYEPRGTYQLIFEYIEPHGKGAFQLAFEQLKAKLDTEGLFNPIHKKTIPFFPEKIGIVTSAKGAVIHDIVTVTQRRCKGIPMEIVQVSVQGQNAVKEIAGAIALLNARASSDVIILARGGGSIEDLHAFNDETVARAIFHSEIPVISAVGHETDVTISDFVSDLRAPTPSAAAEMAVPDKSELSQKLSHLKNQLNTAIYTRVFIYTSKLNELDGRLKNPVDKLYDLRLKNDDLYKKLVTVIKRNLEKTKLSLLWQREKLSLCSPEAIVATKKNQLVYLRSQLHNEIAMNLSSYQYRNNKLALKLETLNPGAVLKRGYSIARSAIDGSIITDASDLTVGDDIDLILSNGSAKCTVNKILK